MKRLKVVIDMITPVMRNKGWLKIIQDAEPTLKFLETIHILLNVIANKQKVSFLQSSYIINFISKNVLKYTYA